MTMLAALAVDFPVLLQIVDSALRLATPLLLACLAGMFSERAGIFDIGLEGKMLAAAFLSASVAALTMNVWLGLAAGIAASLVLAGIHGLAAITFRGNQLISGVAINFLAAGLTVLVGQKLFGLGGMTPQLGGQARFAPLELPLAGTLAQVPVLGPVYSGVVSGHTILVYAAALAVPLSWWVLFRTRFGLRLRAVGENPAAVDTAGVSVVGLRFAAVAICGLLCGIAGAYLATGLSAGFVKDMTAGRGFVALAALIFAKWRPVQAMGACLLFGLLEAFSIRALSLNGILQLSGFLALVAGGLLMAVVALRGRGLAAALRHWPVPALGLGAMLAGAVLTAAHGTLSIPSQAMQALPYVLTVVILAGFVGKAVPPRAGGMPYVKER